MDNVTMIASVKRPMQSYPLIGPNDPPPYSIFNAEGVANVLFVCDHSGRAIPEHMQQLGVADWVLEKHVAWDIGSGDVAQRLATRFDAPLICANYSRLVIDTNRPPDDLTLCVPLSEGIAIPGNMDMDEAEREARIQSFFDPYHAAVDARLDMMQENGTAPALIAVHSCTPVFDRVVRPWHIGVLWDKDPRIALPLLQHLSAMDGVCVGDNEPYSGRHPHDYTMDHHGEAARIPHVSIEIRQDLIDTAGGADIWAKVLGDALEEILADAALFTLRN
ncbi:MAG: N-formylglutamate amidohydrolase [Gammaproteobacteria bacterium]|nr:N-formylglutamate amidohydrolase [Gammaproteobacteria bacterium]